MYNKILIGNLSTEIDEEQIQSLFSRQGAIRAITIPKDAKSGLNRGYAFVEMTTPAAAEKAVQNLNGQELGGRTLNITLVNKQPVKSAKRGWFGLGGN